VFREEIASRATEDRLMDLRRLRRAPVPPAPPPPPDLGAFVPLPPGCLPALTPEQLALYAWALAEAQQAAQPALPERDLLAFWN
jgi:hypothetical protein